ncbi:WD repeat protein [Thecamonas trahens ATCC 50062]|uniref:WD repeat protein n=1 Tax=Thecamonas trahens ATCC 50062 TaxID=461836 RepID=A0A0L0DNW4_THETB|nr:WD repeat protein [Thecamonas trahens ATCC 50062]KNC53093.1 WD repeat protein [Thecamonas trahens ATCC 50062]|eukprot:XP_013754763.1 WD repeat protein [Thecamonas trahens ATCC 50062]
MCRFLLYVGVDPLTVAEVVTQPRHSLCRQTLWSAQLVTGFAVHLDGCGLGWYSLHEDDQLPCVFTSMSPAHNNANLHRLAKATRSRMFMTHVRSATTGSLSEANCHPFAAGKLLFMHNGSVGAFSAGVKRKLLASLRDDIYGGILGSTDSEHIFALFLNTFPQGTDFDHLDLVPADLLAALYETVAQLNAWEAEAAADRGVDFVSYLNIAISDGTTSVATRYVSRNGVMSDSDPSVSLYFATGSRIASVPAPDAKPGDALTDCTMVTENKTPSLVVIASEPLWDSDDWLAVPQNTAMVVTSQIDGPSRSGSTRIFSESHNWIDATPPTSPLSAAAGSFAFPPALLGSPVGLGVSGAAVVDPLDPLAGFTLPQHTTCMVLAELADKAAVAAGLSNGDIRIFDTSSYQLAVTLTGHVRAVTSLLFLQDSDLLLSGSADTYIRVWQASPPHACLGLFNSRSGSVISLAVAPDAGLLYVGMHDGFIRSLVLDDLLAALSEESPIPVSMDAVAAADNPIPLIRQPLRLHPPPAPSPYAAAASESATCSASVCTPCERPVHATANSMHRGSVLCMAYDAGAARLYSGTATGSISVWTSPALQHREALLEGHASSVLAMVLEPGRRLFSGASDTTIRVWDLTFPGPPFCLRVLSRHSSAVVAFAKCADNLVSIGSGGDVCVWSLGSLACLRLVHVPHEPLYGLMLGSTLWIGAANARCAVYDLVRHTGAVSLVESPAASSCAPLLDQLGASEVVTTEALIAMLGEFVAHASVSGSPARASACLAAARHMSDALLALGADVRIVPNPTSPRRNPIVLGRIGADPSKPTLAFYGHYDVQPASPDNGWESDPWTLTPRDGYLYGRGASDDKGPIVAFLAAVGELVAHAKCGSLPINVVFVVEGEEESGSAGLREAIEANSELLGGVDYVLLSNTYWVGDQAPCLTLGMRGVIHVALTVTGPPRDLHSGVDGGAVREPLVDLVHVLDGLFEDGNTRVAVPGFYVDVTETALDLNVHDFDLDRYLDEIGVAPGDRDANTESVLQRRWLLPSLSVHDVQGSFTGSGASSVIPRRATAKVSMRIVPDQSIDTMIARLQAHVDAVFGELNSTNSVAVKVVQAGKWWSADAESPLYGLAAEAVEEVWGAPPLFVREGGSIPVVPYLEETLGAPALHIPMGQASDNGHLANERLRVTNLVNGKRMFRRVMEGLPSLGKVKTTAS